MTDKSGDTAESYAAEWENTECVNILREATAARKATRETSEMFDSDGSFEDSDEDDDDDESSMMNWIMPPPSIPNKVNPPAMPGPTLGSSLPQPVQDPREDIQLSVHLTLPAPASQSQDSDSDTESEDTLVLIQKSKAIAAGRDRESSKTKPASTPCAMSIVDKIKNTLSCQSSQISNPEQEETICHNFLLILIFISRLQTIQLLLKSYAVKFIRVKYAPSVLKTKEVTM